MIIPKTAFITQKRLDQLRNERNKTSYRQWKKDVLCRDKYTCQYPGCDIKKDLEVHHIKKFHTHKHLRVALTNGITLCEKHHNQVTGTEHRYEIIFFKIAQANTEKYVPKPNKNSFRFEGTEPISF